MGLKFGSLSNFLRLIDIRSIEKKGEDGEIKVYNFAKFADEATFESNEFMLPKDINPATLVVQSRYKVVLDIEGKWTRISLTPVPGDTSSEQAVPTTSKLKIPQIPGN